MKIFLSTLNESWVVDRFRKDWYLNNLEISTEKIKESDIIWIISPWVWRKIPKRQLNKKKVVCSIYHIDFSKFDEREKKEFYKRDKYVDIYHVISNKTRDQLSQITDKEIYPIPFWVDQDIWTILDNKENIRKKYKIQEDEFLIGSFQRDTEGKDLKSPKLIKGPDIFLEIVKELKLQNPKVKVLLTGKRRDYLIKNFEELSIPYIYLEMVDLNQVNELYYILNLYIVSSRIEGGPQAIMECAITKTPIVSTDVGIATEVLSSESIYEDVNNFQNAKPNILYAYKNSQKYTIPDGMKKYIEMFRLINES